ncbi:uncharacterized protein METZ01_LOCUS126280 [marine metagenome]|uniref:Uncharacterized protein n=1 Tax=marine metagenome TaxID=408172 RepID=A0A381Y8K2_9ZZZZ
MIIDIDALLKKKLLQAISKQKRGLTRNISCAFKRKTRQLTVVDRTFGKLVAERLSGDRRHFVP